MSLTKADVTNVLQRLQTKWLSHSDGMVDFPLLPNVFYNISLSFSRIQKQNDEIQANQKKIMDKLGVE